MFQKPSPDIALTKNERENNNDQVETVVGPSVHVQGDFSSEGDILVKGSVSGKVSTSRLLTVESGATIFADIKAGSALVSGEIKGNAKVVELLELTETAKILGDISCKTLIVKAGALIFGKVSMPGVKEMEDGEDKPKGKVKSKKKDKEES